ncbi:MAG: hypothetical protein ABSD67_02950 [Terracidiphilus sp.]
MRTIRWEHVTQEQIAAIGCGFKRFDDMFLYLEVALCTHPHVFERIEGTKLSVCFTNDFCGESFPDIPHLRIFFYYDQNYIYIVAIDAGPEYDKEIS